ncbi:MAG: site-specific integrase [Planctomycetaceae bacterium]
MPTTDLERTLPHLGPVVQDMVVLQLLSGARPGEICDLRPTDLDRSTVVWEYRPASHKLEHHGKHRVVYFGKQAQEILAKYLDGRPVEAHCFSPIESEARRLTERNAARKTPLSCGNRAGSKRSAAPKRQPGGRYTVGSYRRAIDRACRRGGVTPWAPNRLRHSRATELRKLFGIEAVRTVLGHSRLSTSEIYAERDLAEARRIMGEVG